MFQQQVKLIQNELSSVPDMIYDNKVHVEMFLSASYTLMSNITTPLSTPESSRAVTGRFFRLKKGQIAANIQVSLNCPLTLCHCGDCRGQKARGWGKQGSPLMLRKEKFPPLFMTREWWLFFPGVVCLRRSACDPKVTIWRTEVVFFFPLQKAFLFFSSLPSSSFTMQELLVFVRPCRSTGLKRRRRKNTLQTLSHFRLS